MRSVPNVENHCPEFMVTASSVQRLVIVTFSHRFTSSCEHFPKRLGNRDFANRNAKIHPCTESIRCDRRRLSWYHLPLRTWIYVLRAEPLVQDEQCHVSLRLFSLYSCPGVLYDRIQVGKHPLHTHRTAAYDILRRDHELVPPDYQTILRTVLPTMLSPYIAASIGIWCSLCNEQSKFPGSL